ncbi:MAG: AmmeMemoRadiSam system radical SAM enzyme [Bacillota bacterium]
MKEAVWYQQLAQKQVRCELCPHYCRLDDGQSGICQVRQNKNGQLVTTSYGELGAMAVDPIEKKPLYHFYPGSDILSLGTVGCNLDCQFCQNYQLAQSKVATEAVTPKQIIATAKKYDSSGIAYTYSEPLVSYEFIAKTAQLAKKEGLQNVVVTNGYLNQQPLEELLPYLDGLNIDLKSFDEEYYHDICHGSLEPVKETIALANQSALVEVTTLVVPGLNDNSAEIEQLVDWLAGIDSSIPLHFTRYFPKHQLQADPTPISRMKEVAEIAKNKLKFVYLGNMRDPEANHTYCYSCGELLVERNYSDVRVYLDNSSCPNCGSKINILLDEVDE